MATATFPRSSATERKAVAGWISGGIANLLTARLGAASAAPIRLAAALFGQAWFGPGVRTWLR